MRLTSRTTVAPKFRPNYVIPDRQADAWRPLTATKGYARRMNRVGHNQGVMIYPDLFSDDPRTMRANELVARELSKIPVNIGPDGVLGSEAVPGDFYALLTVAGHRMAEISVPPVTNQPIRDELGLLTDFASPRDREIFRRLVALMFERAAPAKVSVRKEASTGAPDFISDIDVKLSQLRTALADLPNFLSLIGDGRLRDLFVDYNAPIVSTTGERNQADKFTEINGKLVSKARKVNDELAARTGFKEGRRFDADKTVWVDGRIVEGHAGTRRRTVFGTSFVANYVCAAFCSSWRACYLTEYEFTWKHREPAQILEKMQRYSYLAGFDVTQFDQTVPTFLISEFLSELENYVDGRVVKLIRMLFTCPYMVPWPWMDGYGTGEEFNPLFGDDPFDEGCFEMQVGLPSGISINPDIGKLMMTFQYLVILDRYFGDVLEQGLDVILRGECTRYGMLNMGDDCVLLTNDAGFGLWFEERYEEGKFDVPLNYFKLEPERPISFLGNVPYRNDRGELRLAPNVISYLVNWLVPEHGIDSKKRRDFWAVGDRERRLHYAKAPMYPDVRATFIGIYEAELGFNPEAVATEYLDAQKRFVGYNHIDLLVRQNPDYLHYRVQEDQVSSSVLEEIISSIPAAEAWQYTRSFFGKVNDNVETVTAG